MIIIQIEGRKLNLESKPITKTSKKHRRRYFIPYFEHPSCGPSHGVGEHWLWTILYGSVCARSEQGYVFDCQQFQCFGRQFPAIADPCGIILEVFSITVLMWSGHPQFGLLQLKSSKRMTEGEDGFYVVVEQYFGRW
ncbi:hypothetical protein EVAR_27748_1 [Eumeta japonica]|uniref:Uncharacterized protein n=1 Tax=Eumeta variegata TaxID=151549 RepID=A0A4C1VA04_EUMVA|nr:hypothetical protein EVAR_27748_1 [Eumeta japonica]